MYKVKAGYSWLKLYPAVTQPTWVATIKVSLITQIQTQG